MTRLSNIGLPRDVLWHRQSGFALAAFASKHLGRHGAWRNFLSTFVLTTERTWDALNWMEARLRAHLSEDI